MIKGFRDKGLRRFAETGDASMLSVRNPDRVRRILQRLDAAVAPEDMDAPGFHFRLLTGDRQGRYAVRVTGNWRLTFSFDGQNATDVDLEDYH